jgi:peptide deformylase
MSAHTLIKETDPILSTAAEEWNWEQDGEVADLAKDMLKCMFENDGIGLAAPQIGISKRIFVMGNPQQSYICVNPKILSGQGQVKDQEGCLSFPGLWLHVNRYETIQVEYQDILGKQHQREFTGLIARVFQHEYDHLDGVCFVNRVGELSLKLATRRRSKNLKRI